jgi:hypothetical protein
MWKEEDISDSQRCVKNGNWEMGDLTCMDMRHEGGTVGSCGIR